ncbi:MAG: GAF domain-containing protein [Deltaproteobacteria bacterium]|nr:GAF domain-containing protein [Deltaproteobacteria bacterium]
MQSGPEMYLRTVIGGGEQRYPLREGELRIGRGVDNDVILSDFSVSRNHASIRRARGGWHLFDLMSTNGVQVNGSTISQKALKVGDRISIGVFELLVEKNESVVPAASRSPGVDREPTRSLDELHQEISNASIVRPLSEFTALYGIEPSSGTSKTAAQPVGKPLGADDAGRIVGFLTRLAGLLITAESVDEVLTRVTDILFEALAVERGFILLQDEDGEISCELARSGRQLELRPQSEVPVSRTMLQAVMQKRVALLTHDALSDKRLVGGESIRLHGIRSAMCAPLWSGERIIGVMQVDSPLAVGSFQQQDLDFLTAVANYAAVAVERLRYAERVQVELEMRSRLERYHSPLVIEEVMRREAPSTDPSVGRLKVVEATVLFADMVGFTAYAERLAPEEVAGLLESYFTYAVDAIFSAGGTLDKFIGDCVMAFFGAPIAQEDHAVRAVRASVSLLDSLDGWNRERESRGLPTLASRIAVNSGPVVVGDIGSNRRVDYTVLGNTVNVAARLEQSVAQPGEVVIGPETHRLLDGELETESLGDVRLKGLQETVEAYRVLRPGYS